MILWTANRGEDHTRFTAQLQDELEDPAPGREVLHANLSASPPAGGLEQRAAVQLRRGVRCREMKNVIARKHMAKEERLAHTSATVKDGHGGTRPQEQCTKGLLFALTVN